ncbi:hypothetical protein EV291_14413 [Rhizobium sp. BK068]|nr:hypothetical protein EV291_14413 [Rhizobium sp. BK068]
MPRAGTLEWTYFQAHEAGFRRTPVLLTGDKAEILIDGGFTLSDGPRLGRLPSVGRARC